MTTTTYRLTGPEGWCAMCGGPIFRGDRVHLVDEMETCCSAKCAETIIEHDPGDVTPGSPPEPRWIPSPCVWCGTVIKWDGGQEPPACSDCQAVEQRHDELGIPGAEDWAYPDPALGDPASDADGGL